MNKQLILVLLTLVALVSCSKDKSLSVNNGTAINFRTAINTRAYEINTSNIEEFTVVALKGEEEQEHFGPTRFYRDSNTNSFISSPERYWPKSGNDQLDFYAFYPTEGTTADISSESKKLTYDIRENGQVDFITARASCTKTVGASGVELNFKHQCAQIEFWAKSSNPHYTFAVFGTMIDEIKMRGSFDFETDSWELAGENWYQLCWYEGAGAVLGDEYTKICDGDNLMVLPQTLTAWDCDNDSRNRNKGAYIALNIRIWENEPRRIVFQDDWACIPIDMELEAGMKYIFKLDYTDGCGKVDPEDHNRPGQDIILKAAVKFTVDVETWEDAAPIVPNMI